MKFITVVPVNEESRELCRGAKSGLLYIAEFPVKVGDIVEANIYSTPVFQKVIAVGSTRKAAKSTWTGSVKSAIRVVSPAEAKAIERVERATRTLATAELNLRAAQRRAGSRLVLGSSDITPGSIISGRVR